VGGYLVGDELRKALDVGAIRINLLPLQNNRATLWLLKREAPSSLPLLGAGVTDDEPGMASRLSLNTNFTLCIIDYSWLQRFRQENIKSWLQSIINSSDHTAHSRLCPVIASGPCCIQR